MQVGTMLGGFLAVTWQQLKKGNLPVIRSFVHNPTLISYLEEHKEFQSGHERSSESDERLGESLGGRVIH